MKLSAIPREFSVRQFLPSLTAGVIAAITTISIEISLAALIFSGNLSVFLARGIGLLLFGAFAMGIVVSLTTSLPGMIGIPQDTPAAILALVAAAIALNVKKSDPETMYMTVLAAVMITSLASSLFFLLLGWFKAGIFVRYVPYPVIGGFLAGTGLLIAKGALGVMANVPVSLGTAMTLFQSAKLVAWLPGVAFAIALLLALRKSSHFLITPGALFLAAGVFYSYLALAQIPLAQAAANGWLLGPFPAGGLYHPVSLAAFAQIDWQAILQNSGQLLIVMLLSAVSLLLNASALEVEVKKDINLDRELMTAGLANLAGGLGGSSVGYQTLSLSALANRLGARSRLVNLISALLCGAVLFFGAAVVGYFPRVVLGGMLLFLGLSFLVEWLVDAFRILPLTDYILIWIILAIIAGFGFLQGIGAGILIATLIFVISYSRVNAIKNVLDGRVYHSSVDRPKHQRDLLEQKGAQIHILRLQGFLFFGTIQKILEEIRQRQRQPDMEPLKYLVLDFQRVDRIDSSAAFGITRLKQLSRSTNVAMVWSDLAPGVFRLLERAGLTKDQDAGFVIQESLDLALEWSENRLFESEKQVEDTTHTRSGVGPFKAAFPGLGPVERVMTYLERKIVSKGEVLMRQGDAPLDMYFILSGLFAVQVGLPGGKILRLRSVRAGTTVGEMGLYLGALRTADVVVEQPGLVYRLTAQALEEMCAKEPETASRLHEWVARLLADRVGSLNRTIEALME